MAEPAAGALNLESSSISPLLGESEMGQLIKKHDWSASPLGIPSLWPRSLLTTLNIILHSRFPMFLFWGADHICFYNDAYRPSLGNNGKHPFALGSKGKEVWPEIWDQIGPMIGQVMSGGGATWSEDQLLHIYRNGMMEDVYWTFSYSAVFDDEYKPAGVFVACTETTRTVVTLQTLRESEQRFQNMVRDATAGICVVLGKEMKVGIANQAYTNLMDRKVEELVGRDLFEVIPEAKEHFYPLINTVRLTGEPLYHNEYPYFVLVDGRRKEGYVNLVFQPYREAGGPVTGVLMLCQDVTESVISKKRLQESETNLRNIILQSPVANSLLVGADKTIRMVNERMLQIWGLKEEDVLNKPVCDAVPASMGQGFKDMLSKVYNTGETVELYAQPTRVFSGEQTGTMYINWVFQAFHDPGGSIAGIMVAAVNVSDLVEASKRIEVAEERARLAVQSAEMGIFEVNFMSNTLEADERFYQIYGFDRSANWKDVLSGIHPDDFHIRQKAIENAIKAGALDYQARFIRPDGSMLWIRGKGKVLYNEQHQATRIIGVVQDITEHKQFAEELEKKVRERTNELKEANEQLIHTNAELNQFAYVASHDLQEPLRKVKTFTSLLESSLPEVPEKSANFLKKIQDSTARMQTLIFDILQFSQLSKEREKFEWVDLNEVVKEVLGDYELLIEQKGALVVIDPLPRLEVIPLQISQLFTNLISNALKFKSVDRELKIHVSVRVLPASDAALYHELDTAQRYYEIVVSDNGIGFSQEYAKQIFVIFQRLHNRSRYEGTGIGLALCKKIVLNHSGLIFAHSQPDHGATFTILLPAEHLKSDS